jgi:hypothetical protein
MLFEHIENLIKKELEFFNGDYQIKKRIIENILKKPSKITEKLIEIIAYNSVKPEQPKETTDSCTGTGSKPVDNKKSAASVESATSSSATSSSAASVESATSSSATSSSAASVESNKKDIFNIDIEKVVHEFSNWLDYSIEKYFEQSNKEEAIQECIKKKPFEQEKSEREEDSDKKIVLCIDDVDHGGPASCENYKDIYQAAAKIHSKDMNKGNSKFEPTEKHEKIMEDLNNFKAEMDKKSIKNTSGENKSDVVSNSKSNVEDEIVKVSIDAINNQLRSETDVNDITVEVVEDEKKRKNL